MEAGLATAILTNQRKVIIQHPRNVGAEIYFGPEVSSIFAPSVWRCFNQPFSNQGKVTTLRMQLLDQWQHFGVLPPTNVEGKPVVLPVQCSGRGKYTAADLANRANMNDQVESYINRMLHDNQPANG